MTAPARPGARPHEPDEPDERPGAVRPLVVTGAMAACAAMVTGLVILTPLVLAGWIAAPHAGLGLPGVLRTATGLWLAAHHVGFALHDAEREHADPPGVVQGKTDVVRREPQPGCRAQHTRQPEARMRGGDPAR